MSDITAPYAQRNQRWIVFTHALLFVLGFSLIFVIGWGGTATFLGQFFGTYKNTIGRLGGLVVIMFGMANLGIIRIPWLYYDIRPEYIPRNHSGFLASGIMGIFFAAGWTPCIGTTLGAILTLGLSQQNSGQAMLLSSGYALGLGVPFLLIGLGIDRVTIVIKRFQRYMRHIQIASGIFLILIGVVMVTNQLTRIAIWAQRNRLFLNIPVGSSGIPTYSIAVLAGLLSFLSPCVLPLVPAYIGYLNGHAFSKK